MSDAPGRNDTQSQHPDSEDLKMARILAAMKALDTPETIGPYRILGPLGEGGMGAVYLAEQTEPIHRRVALKIIKLGMDTKQVIARFEAEREALALMNHPNVARVLDAGTTDTGRPYFVMEHVPGIPITDYCDRHRLTTEERLRLFIDVCNAVQHAHQKGIIHRDLKPSNVLVAVQDGNPICKVIDFGVAKATQRRWSEPTLFTEQGQLIGTPGYMSPEQAEMTALGVDTRTDIYSLGVMIYELLAGTLPFETKALRQAGVAEIQRIIREVDPPKPSTKLSNSKESTLTVAHNRRTEPRRLLRLLRGDLDWIVMKCIEKDRTRRYDTANAIAVEIQRFLNNEPILTSPPTSIYRFRKFVRRNRGAVLAGVLICVTGVVGIFTTSLGLAWALKEQERAIAAASAEKNARQLAELRESEAIAARADANEKNLLAERRAAEAENGAYLANIRGTNSALREGDFEALRRSLDACPPRLRNWEWGYYNAISDTSLEVLEGHEDWVVAAAFSPEGNAIVTASKDKTARVWNASSGETIAVLQGHGNEILSASFNSDGTRIATASHDGTARIWDATTGEEILILRGHVGGVVSAAFSPNSTRVATASWDGTARLWDASSGKVDAVLRGHDGYVWITTFSPDGHQLLTASQDGTARIWDISSGSEIFILRGHVGPIRSAAYSRDGALIATASWDKTGRVWDAKTGEELFVLFGHDEKLDSIAFNANNSLILTSAGDSTSRIWDAIGGVQIAALRGHDGAVFSAQFSPDSTRVITASIDGTARLWDTKTAKEVAVLRGHRDAVLTASFSPDGINVLTTSWDYSARVWSAEPADASVVHTICTGIRFAQLSPDGKMAATGSNNDDARIWDLSTGREGAALAGESYGVYSAVFNFDNSNLATAAHDGSIRIWSLPTGQELALLRSQGAQVSSFSFSPDGFRLIAISEDGSAQLWDVPTGRQIAELNEEDRRIQASSFRRNGSELVTVERDGTCRQWSAKTGQEIALPIQLKSVTFAVFSPDGNHLVARSADGTARLWDWDSGTELCILHGPNSAVENVAFSPNGRWLAAESDDDYLQIWDTVTGQKRTDLRQPVGALAFVAFSPDGKRLAMSSYGRYTGFVIGRPFDPIVRLFDTETGDQVAVLDGHDSPVRDGAFSADGTRFVTVTWDGKFQTWDSVPTSERNAAATQCGGRTGAN